MASTALNDAITSSLQSWNEGQQQAAVDTLRPHAESGERAAVLLLSWFLSQMGQPFWTEGLTYAQKAIELGIPQAASYYFGTLIGDPNYRNQVPPLVSQAIAGGWPLDPVPNAPGTLASGDPATAVALIQAAAVPRPYPDAWQGLIAQGQSDFEALRTAAGAVSERRDAAAETIASIETAIGERQREVDQRAHSLLALIDRITNAQATSYFEDEATQYGGEAKWLWRGGFAVLIFAACAALIPLVNYYYDRIYDITPWLSGRELVTAHAGAALAFGAVAGVLLARARGRDRARQRARNLSVALQTMFVYAEQIADPAERQAFIRDMGRTVLEAFLRQDAPAIDTDRGLLAAIRAER